MQGLIMFNRMGRLGMPRCSRRPAMPNLGPLKPTTKLGESCRSTSLSWAAVETSLPSRVVSSMGNWGPKFASGKAIWTKKARRSGRSKASSNVARARFSPQEVADLTLSFYKRNYIEGLFLSSGIVKSANHTMEQLIEAARILREEHDFRGYIHLKTIPEADALFGPVMGRPKTAMFKTTDLVGLDVMSHVAQTLLMSRRRVRLVHVGMDIRGLLTWARSYHA